MDIHFLQDVDAMRSCRSIRNAKLTSNLFGRAAIYEEAQYIQFPLCESVPATRTGFHNAPQSDEEAAESGLIPHHNRQEPHSDVRHHYSWGKDTQDCCRGQRRMLSFPRLLVSPAHEDENQLSV